MTDSDQSLDQPPEQILDQTPEVSELITDFVEHIEVEKGRAKNTAENYERYLYRFLEIAGDISGKGDALKPSDITPELLRKFRLQLNRLPDDHGENLKVITQSYYLIAFR